MCYPRAMAAALKIPETMTTTEFLAWDAPGKLWQLIEGTPRAMAPPSPAHGAIQAEIARLLGNHLVERGSPCRIINTPGVVGEGTKEKEVPGPHPAELPRPRPGHHLFASRA
jgi:Uma2 family endonuclease